MLMFGACSYVHDPGAYFEGDWEEGYTQVSACQKSGDHGGNHVTVWLNATEDELNTMAPPYDAGVVWLKAQYSDAACTSLSGFTVMRKGSAGTAPETGDWQWQTVGEYGEITGEGQLGGCIGCHTGASDTDYAFTDLSL